MLSTHISSVRSGLYDKDPHKKIYMKTHTFCYDNLSEICRLITPMHMQAPFLTRILVIDEIPLISVGLQEVFRTIHPAIRVEYTDSVFRVLSSRDYESKSFHLVILGSDEERSSGSLLLQATELKQRFAGSRIIVYTDQYNPELIAKTAEGIIDACIHKHEPAEEIKKAYEHLSKGETYISSIFDTLYYSYRFHG